MSTAPVADLTQLHQRLYQANGWLSMAIVALAADRNYSFDERMDVLRKLVETIDRPASVAPSIPRSSMANP